MAHETDNGGTMGETMEKALAALGGALPHASCTATEAIDLLNGASRGPYAVATYAPDDHAVYAEPSHDLIVGQIRYPADAAILAASWDLASTVIALEAKIAALTAELEKPVAGTWWLSGWTWVRRNASALFDGASVARVEPHGWRVRSLDGEVISGPETGEEGRRAADAAAISAGWRLV